MPDRNPDVVDIRQRPALPENDGGIRGIAHGDLGRPHSAAVFARDIPPQVVIAQRRQVGGQLRLREEDVPFHFGIGRPRNPERGQHFDVRPVDVRHASLEGDGRRQVVPQQGQAHRPDALVVDPGEVAVHADPSAQFRAESTIRIRSPAHIQEGAERLRRQIEGDIGRAPPGRGSPRAKGSAPRVIRKARREEPRLARPEEVGKGNRGRHQGVVDPHVARRTAVTEQVVVTEANVLQKLQGAAAGIARGRLPWSLQTEGKERGRALHAESRGRLRVVRLCARRRQAVRLRIGRCRRAEGRRRRCRRRQRRRGKRRIRLGRVRIKRGRLQRRGGGRGRRNRSQTRGAGQRWRRRRRSKALLTVGCRTGQQPRGHAPQGAQNSAKISCHGFKPPTAN